MFRVLEQRGSLLWEIVDDSELRVTDEVISKLGALHREGGIRFSVHTPFMGKDILAADRAKRDESISDVRRSIELAHKYDAEYAVIHAGYKNETVSQEEIVEIWSGLLDFCEGLGIVGVIENLTHKSVFSSPEDLYRLKKVLRKPSFVLDLGHANVEGNLGGFVDAIREFSYFHLHDNAGDNDSHLRLGRGNIDWDRFFSKVVQLRIEAPLMIENMTVEDLDESVQFALKRLT
ncbi:MAG TPA: sugar phosphate isomerase/epimerase family protein [Thermoproteota archaeon]|nr:sugar phosphate isomerase/epimerase family protein [Thermoproteota archaeon]